MTCPECQSLIVADQHFCRDCGYELIERFGSRRLRTAGVAVLGAIFLGLLIAMFGKMFEMKWLSYIGLVILMTGAFAIAVWAFLKDTPLRKHVRHAVGPVQAPPIEKAGTTNKLLPVGARDFIPSVSENTTDILKTPVER